MQRVTDANNSIECYYCGKPRDIKKNYYKRSNDLKNEMLQQGNYVLSSDDRKEQLFVMQHILSSVMRREARCSSDVWYID